MAEPKKRTNRSKRNMRRMHDKIASPSIVYCPECHNAMRKHAVCPSCGKYKGVQVIDNQEKAKMVENSEQ